MKKWIFSVIAGLAGALLVFAFTRNIKHADRAKKYSGEYDVQVILRVPTDSAPHMDFRQVVHILDERLKAYDHPYKYKIDPAAHSMHVSVQHITDTTIPVEMLTNNGRIEFTELYTVKDLQPLLMALREELNAGSKTEEEPADTAAVNDTSITGLISTIHRDEKKEKTEQQVRDLIIISQSYGYGNSPEYYPAEFGKVQIRDTAALARMFEKPSLKALMPSPVFFSYGIPHEGIKNDQTYLPVYAIKKSSADAKAVLEGEDVTYAKAEVSEGQLAFMVSLEFSPRGTQVWRELTRKNVNRCIAIFYNEKVISAPQVESEITNGRALINGNFTEEEARLMASKLKAGALQCRLQLLHSELHPENSKQALTDLLITAFSFLLFGGLTLLLFKFLNAK